MKFAPRLRACFSIVVIFFLGRSPLAAQIREHKTLILFFDGLRPDYITPEMMPNLYSFKQRSAYGNQHHSVFPTVTRVNSSAYSSGSYPNKTGLMGNSVYFPSLDSTKGMETGDAKQLFKINKITGGKLLTTITLGEVLQKAGKKLMIFSSGSSGQALLQNYTISGGAIINPDLILPDSIAARVLHDLGPPPAAAIPNSARHRWVVDALCKYGLTADGPAVSALWMSEPDGAAHTGGIGSPMATEALKDVDQRFGQIIAYLTSEKRVDRYNILVSTDHGFITHIGKSSVLEFLMEKGFKQTKTSTDVVVTDGAIYVKDHDRTKISQIVSMLQQQEWIGGLFTKGKHATDLLGAVPGTLSFYAIHWNHPTRAADILITPNWNTSPNGQGYPGTDLATGIAGHGGFSPYEVHIPLIIAGPDIIPTLVSELPTSNVDIAPTVLALNHIQVPRQMDGRTLSEFFIWKSKAFPSVTIENIETNTSLTNGRYFLRLQRTVLGQYTYPDFLLIKRDKN